MLPDLDQFTALGTDLLRFLPELVLAGGVILLLLLRLVPKFDRAHLGTVSTAVAAAALVAAVWQSPGESSVFTGLLALDGLAVYLRILLLAFTVLLSILCLLTGIPDRDDAADFGVLLLGGTLGLMLMVSANHLLIVFLGLEMASLPSYALAGFLKGRRTGSEAALKYVLYGAASAGVALYGISLLTAAFGTGDLTVIASRLTGGIHGPAPFLPLAGLVLLLVGFGFKLAVVPFHFWLPDVFDGATAEVGAFLSVASKAAAVGLTARVLLALQDHSLDLLKWPETLGLILIVVAAITATLGNLAALGQTNLKRMLGYSTIAHAGYMLMGLATFRREGVAAVLVYLAGYLLMNLGAFAVVAVVRNRTGSETVAACRGLIARSPAVGVPLAVFLASLLGLPPLAGFAGKFLVFAAVYDAGQFYGGTLGVAFTVLLAVGVLNTVVSAGYYLAILRSAGLDEPTDPQPLGESWGVAVYLGLLAVALVVVGVAWGPLAEWATTAVGERYEYAVTFF